MEDIQKCKCGHLQSLHLSGGIGVCDQYVNLNHYCHCGSFNPSEDKVSCPCFCHHSQGGYVKPPVGLSWLHDVETRCPCELVGEKEEYMHTACIDQTKCPHLPTSPQPSWEIEALSKTLHGIYQAEAKRQGDVRHKDAYEDLPENIKEFDRVLARFISKLLLEVREDEGLKYRKDGWILERDIKEAEQRGYKKGRSEQFADGFVVMSPNEIGSLIKIAETARKEERQRIKSLIEGIVGENIGEYPDGSPREKITKAQIIALLSNE